MQQEQNIYKYKKSSDLDFQCRFQLPPKNIFDPITPAYGYGIGLYFDLLYQFFKIFLLITTISIAQWYLNIKGNGIYGRFKFLTNTWTIANQPLNIDSSMEDADYQQIMSLYILCDFAYSIVLFTYLYFARSKSYKKLYKVKSQSNSIKDYTIEVSGFPSEVTNALDIKFHFEQLGGYKFDVSECILQRNYDDILSLQNKNLQLQRQLEIQLNRSDILQDITDNDKQNRQNKLNLIKIQLQQVENNINSEIKGKLAQKELKSVKAFVSFSTKIQREKAISLYKEKNKSLKYEQFYTLKVIKAQDPQSYIWKNQEANPFIGKIVTICIGIALSIPVIITILLFHSYQYWNIDKFSCLSKNFQIYSSEYKECYCVYGINPKQIEKITCDKDYYWLNTHGNCSFAVIVNLLCYFIRVLIEYFVRGEKNSTKYIQNRAILFNVFLWLFLNGIFFIFFFNIVLDDVSLSKYISYIFGSLSVNEQNIKNKLPSDINRNWSINVGQKYIYIAKFNVVYPYIVQFAYFLFTLFTKEIAQEKQKVDSIINELGIQIRKDDPDINHNYQFALASRYAVLAFTIFLGIVFSGPIPFLILICAGEIGTILFYDRYTLNKYNSVNIVDYQNLEEEYVKLGIYFLKFLPLSILLHLIVSIDCYSSVEIFPNIQALNYIENQDKKGNLIFSQRLSKSLILTILFFVLLLFYVLVDLLGFNRFLKGKKIIKEIEILELKLKNPEKEDEITKKIDQQSRVTSKTFEESVVLAKQQGRLVSYDLASNSNYSYLVSLVSAQTNKEIEQFRLIKIPIIGVSSKQNDDKMEEQQDVKQQQNINQNNTVLEQTANLYNFNNFSFISPNNLSILSPINVQNVLQQEDDKIIEELVGEGKKAKENMEVQKSGQSFRISQTQRRMQ